MARSICLAAILAGASCLLGFGQDAPRTPAAEVAAMKKDYADAFDAFRTAVGKIKDEDKRDEFYRANYPKPAARYAQFLALAEKHPTDPAAFEALVWVLSVDPGPTKDQEEADARDKQLRAAEALLLRDHLNRDELPQIFAMADEPFLKTVWEKSAKPPSRGEAGLVMAERRAREVRDVSRWRAENPGWEKQKAAVERGDARFAAWARWVNPDLPRLEREAEELFERLAKDYADVPVQRHTGKTIGAAAKAHLYEMRHLGIGKPLPELKSVDLAGRAVSIADLKGRVVVIDVWATWCGACHQMLPGQRALVKRLEGKPFTLVSVSADEKAEQVTEFLKATPMPWVHWFDGPDGRIQQVLNVTSYPTVYVIDAKGVIRHKDIRGKRLDAAVEALVAEIETGPASKR